MEEAIRLKMEEAVRWALPKQEKLFVYSPEKILELLGEVQN
jgi:hypothetical protein